MGYVARLIGTVFVALVLGSALALLVLTDREAWAQAPPTQAPPTMDPAEEAFRLRKWLERTKPSDFTSPAQSNANRQVLTQAARAKLNGLGAATRLGLAGVAAGVWIHNGIMLQNAIQCGETSCNTPLLLLDGEFKQAELNGQSGFMFRTDNRGRRGAVIWESMTYSGRSTVAWTVRYSFTNDYAASTGGSYDFAVAGPPPCSAGTHCGAWIGNPGAPRYNGGTDTYYASIDSGQQRQLWIQNHPTIDGVVTPQEVRQVGPVVTYGQATSWQNPIFEMGATTATSDTASPPAGTYTASPSETRGFLDQIRGMTSASEAPSGTTPEMVPDYFPEEWEEEFPDVGEPGPYDDPYGNPDGDEKPNHADPDDDGDGVEDENDPEPYDPYSPKLWLDPDFRVPSDPQQREALWGPVVGTWTTPGGGECKEFEGGAQLCDLPDGSTFAWVAQDDVAWTQHPDGSKSWMARPGQRSARTSPEDPGTTTLYRVIEPEELQDVEQFGDYGLSPNGGKYFGVTEQGVRDFANKTLNRDRELTLTSVEVPNGLLREYGDFFNDSGGAGPSYYFRDGELAEMYEVMGPVKVLGRAN